MLRPDNRRLNRNHAEDTNATDDFFSFDLCLKERVRSDRSLDRFIPRKVEKRLFSLHPPSANDCTAEIKSKDSSSEDFNKRLIDKHNREQFEDILETNLILSAEKNQRRGWTEKKSAKGRKLFCYSTNKKTKDNMHDDALLLTFDNKRTPSENLRKIDCTPTKVLDAPGMEDDFYKQVLEWTEKNVLLVALQNSIYSWSPDTNATAVVYTSENKEDKISAIRSHSLSQKLVVGTQGGILLLVGFQDGNSETLGIDYGRISCIDSHGSSIAVGCKEKCLMLIDTRSGKEIDIMDTLGIPYGEVCGVKFSPNGHYLAAGTNDNRFIVVDLKSMKIIINSIEHKAAVRAIGWSQKNPNLVASGGGRKDKCINFWNITMGKLERKIQTDSQVCGISFSKSSDEFLSTHGFSHNNIQVWETKNYSKIAELTGHTERVLYSALNPDGGTLVTSSADETLRFWDVFPKGEEFKNKKTVFHTLLNLR